MFLAVCWSTGGELLGGARGGLGECDFLGGVRRLRLGMEPANEYTSQLFNVDNSRTSDFFLVFLLAGDL